MSATAEPTLAPYRRAVREAQTIRRVGRVSQLTGLVAAVRGIEADVGELCLIQVADRPEPVLAEVVGFRSHETLVMPLGELPGIGPGTQVIASGHPFQVKVGEHLLGRILDGLGRPLDGHPLPEVSPDSYRDTIAPPPSPLARRRITERLELGVRALDTLIPCGKGQRLGIFAGSGVGKSSLMGMIARHAAADVNVICLVGERGRELRDFIEKDLGEEGLARSVVVCATSDQPALVRIKAALVATTIAEHFRDRGRQVMLMMDSVTRLAQAQREVGLAIGEPPATRSYPPSVWALLPQVLERAGATEQGSITALYTVLVEGDDMNEPVADAVRAILDGHVVLDRNLAHRNHYPAIDALASVSRLVDELVGDEVKAAAAALRSTLARYREKEDMVTVGAYETGTDPLLDYAIIKLPAINQFLQQALDQPTPAAEADSWLVELMSDYPSDLAAPKPKTAQPEPDPDPSTPAIPTLRLNG